MSKTKERTYHILIGGNLATHQDAALWLVERLPTRPKSLWVKSARKSRFHSLNSYLSTLNLFTLLFLHAFSLLRFGALFVFVLFPLYFAYCLVGSFLVHWFIFWPCVVNICFSQSWSLLTFQKSNVKKRVSIAILFKFFCGFNHGFCWRLWKFLSSSQR